MLIMLLYLYAVIIQEIGIDGEKVEELLKRTKGKLDVEFLNQALEFATWMDSDANVGKIALAHLGNIKHCIRLAEKEGKHHAYVMLSLVKAASSGDKEILNHLLLEPVSEEEKFDIYNYIEEDKEEPLSFVHCGLCSVNVSSKVPIEIAQQSNQIIIVNELLMKTNVCPDEGYVYWVGLQLRAIDTALLREIYWVKKLRLCRNKLTTLPEELCDYLKQV